MRTLLLTLDQAASARAHLLPKGERRKELCLWSHHDLHRQVQSSKRRQWQSLRTNSQRTERRHHQPKQLASWQLSRLRKLSPLWERQTQQSLHQQRSPPNRRQPLPVLQPVQSQHQHQKKKGKAPPSPGERESSRQRTHLLCTRWIGASSPRRKPFWPEPQRCIGLTPVPRRPTTAMSAATTMSPRTGVQVTPNPTVLWCWKTTAVSRIVGLLSIAGPITPSLQTTRQQRTLSYIGGSISHPACWTWCDTATLLNVTTAEMCHAVIGIDLSVEPLPAGAAFHLLPNSLPSHPRGLDKRLFKPPYSKSLTPPTHPSEVGLPCLSHQEKLAKVPAKEVTSWGWDLFFSSSRHKWHAQAITSVGCDAAKNPAHRHWAAFVHACPPEGLGDKRRFAADASFPIEQVTTYLRTYEKDFAENAKQALSQLHLGGRDKDCAIHSGVVFPRGIVFFFLVRLWPE